LSQVAAVEVAFLAMLPAVVALVVLELAQVYL
jgi:hypothetical protein